METAPVYTDFQSLAALRGVEGLGESKRLEDVAEQFASVFTHMMLKSMRDASLGDGIFDSQQSIFYRDMFDQQLALSLSEGDGVGISGMLSDHLRSVTGLSKPGPDAAESGQRARSAYESVQRLATEATQDQPESADRVISRNELHRDAENGLTLRWRGQAPR